MAAAEESIEKLETPCLLLEEGRMHRNADRLRQRLARFPVTFRPHFKTPKCIEVFRAMCGAQSGPATVSTLKEAEFLLENGISDILYAVGITPNKLDHVSSLRRRGANLKIILDSAAAALKVADHCKEAGDPIPVLLEIDGDGHRAGLKPDDAGLLGIARILADSPAKLAGVLTHAGGSYACADEASLIKIAERERLAVVSAAEALRAAGFGCPIVSVGSTPTAHFAENLAGVTEVRAGVYIFFDLVMAGIGVCRLEDIAISVLASVLGHQQDRGWIIVDAGWMSMSRDRGTEKQAIDQFYGVVCDLDGRPYPDLVLLQANQEHGILGLRPGSSGRLPDLQVGAMVRVLPNHACATAAQHDRYVVVNGGRQVKAVWPRINGW